MKIAVITTVRNEEFFLPHFIRHYEREVDGLYILDNDSSDRSVEQIASNPFVKVEKYSSSHLFERLKINKALDVMERIRSEYEWAIIVDVDEFVVARFEKTIRRALQFAVKDNPDRPIFGTDGYNMHRHPDDHPIVSNRLLIEQRRWGVKNDHYSKPIIVRTDFRPDWALGCHFLQNPDMDPKADPPHRASFRLLHYRWAVDDMEIVRRGLELARRIDPAFSSSYYRNVTAQSLLDRARYERESGKLLKIV